ncbi:MAG: family 43 glycosylhydrolase [Clostridiales bacterium]|nr:family 43 glycosylhydrolase [Clostridiales bacterium]
MKRNKLLAVLLTALLCVSFAACGDKPATLMAYETGVAADGSYDTSLFFRNDLNLNHAADPGAIWVSKEEHEADGGYFYVYATTVYDNFIGFRSKDLSNWESLGTVIDWGEDAEDRWCKWDLWAPEVIRGSDGKYYMYFTACYGQDNTNYTGYIGVAVSDSPAGPFVYYTGENLLGEQLDIAHPTMELNLDHPAYVVDGETISENKSKVAEENQGWGKEGQDKKDPNYMTIIDVSPFFDDDGRMYLYMRIQYSHQMATSSWAWPHLAVVEMADMVTPIYDTFTELTYPGFASLADKEANIPFAMETGSRLDEAPFMIKHNGVYYLTYAPIGYEVRNGYSVSVAVSDSPTGPFVKMKREHGNPTLCIDADQDHMAGPGHHAFVYVGDEIFVIYHSLLDRASGNANPRGIAYDRITFVDGSTYGITAAEYGFTTASGTFDMLYSNGPTWSPQPLPYEVSGYRNMAGKAKVTVKDGDKATARYLTDGLFVSHEYAAHIEYRGKAGGTTVTLEFAEAQEVAAVMIYNSYDFAYAFKSIDEIRFELASSPAWFNGNTTVVAIRNLPFDPTYYNVASRTIRPGCAATARFNPIKVKKITIKVSAQLDQSGEAGDGIKISDIAVLAK